MKPDPPELEDLLDYPASFTFRVVAKATPTLEADCRASVERVLDRPAINTDVASSSKGAWASVRVTTVVISADEIRAVYAELKSVPDLKILL